jgi:hypothetical protein
VQLTVQLGNVALVESGGDAREVDDVEQGVNVRFYVVHDGQM